MEFLYVGVRTSRFWYDRGKEKSVYLLFIIRIGLSSTPSVVNELDSEIPQRDATFQHLSSWFLELLSARLPALLNALFSWSFTTLLLPSCYSYGLYVLGTSSVIVVTNLFFASSTVIPWILPIMNAQSLLFDNEYREISLLKRSYDLLIIHCRAFTLMRPVLGSSSKLPHVSTLVSLSATLLQDWIHTIFAIPLCRRLLWPPLYRSFIFSLLSKST